MKSFKNTLIQFTQNGMGSDDEELGVLLANNYLKLLSEEKELPTFIVFYNSGVKLICKDSPTSTILKILEQKGVKLIACKTCLNHFKLTESLHAGITGTMMDIIELQKLSEKVISL